MTAEETIEPDDLDDPVDGAVLRYTYRLAGGELIDLEEYCLEFPAAMREELRERCQHANRIQETLRRGAASSTASGGSLPEGAETFERIGKYERIRELGSGSMGTVFLARSTETGREVALKVLAFNLQVSARAVQRFRREMVAASKLEHPGIVEIIEVGEDRGLLFMAMEYIDGASLEELLQRAASEQSTGGSGELELPDTPDTPTNPVGRVVQIVTGVADALYHAHRRGVIHRDVKPANIMIDREGRPRLLDFGLAKDCSEHSISRTGDLAGTPAYMSPEQAMSKRIDIDHRTDIFSLGVVFYEMLARHRPFAGDTIQRLFYEIAFKEPESLRRLRPDLPRDAITICEKAMSKDPDHRFPNAGEMARDLRRFLNHESIIARPVGVVRKWFRRAKARPLVTTLAATLVVVLMMVPFLLAWWSRLDRLELALEEAQAFLQREEYSLEGPRPRPVWEGLRLEQELREFEPAHGSEAEAALLELERRRLALAEEMEAYVTATATPELSWLSPEIRLAREAEYRLIAPVLRTGEADDWSGEDPFRARLTVTSEPPGAEVYLQALSRIDSAPLQRRYAGLTPLSDYAFDPGLLRVVILLGDRSAELTRDFTEPGGDYREEVTLRSSNSVVADMVEIAAGSFVFGSGTEENWPHHEREMTVRAFHADLDEVSNAEYRRFVDATSADPPPLWPDPYDTKWDDRPVVQVNRDAAQAYAEWAGKRLPTIAEWQRMARGPEGFSYPTGNVVPDFAEFVMCKEPIEDPFFDESPDEMAIEATRRLLLDTLEAVDREGTPTGPEGLMHTLDNVSEWTESFLPSRDSKGRIDTMDGVAIWMGGWWHSRQYTLDEVGVGPPELSDLALGFRCVKSVNP